MGSMAKHVKPKAAPMEARDRYTVIFKNQRTGKVELEKKDLYAVAGGAIFASGNGGKFCIGALASEIPQLVEGMQESINVMVDQIKSRM